MTIEQNKFLSPQTTVALSNCEQELIHLPGAIQPHGILFVLQEPRLKIVQVSNNTAEFLGIPAQKILGKTLNTFLDSQQIDLIKQALSEPTERINPLNLSIKNTREELFFYGILHRSEEMIILELEPCGDRKDGDFFGFYYLVQHPIVEIQKASNLEELEKIIVRKVRNLTGFDRVMLYKFDYEDAGTVIAEDKSESLTSYLDLHYPSSDIPQQARKLFKLNPLRLISDIYYQPVKLLPTCNPVTKQPLDLSSSVLRSVSPLHREYLKSMGVTGSMTISLSRDKKLWGLIACHHQSPKYISYKIRTACELLSKVIALEIGSKENDRDANKRIKLKSIFSEYVKAFAENDDWIEVLRTKRAELLALTNAHGAVVYDDRRVTIIGKTPELKEIKKLVAWLEKQFLNNNNYFYCVNSLAKVYPSAEKYKDVGSGLLVVAISHQPKQYILWFRPEVIQTVTWGRNPNQPVAVEQNDRMRMSPRKSFELWQETVQLKSLPWNPPELEIVQELRNVIISIVARQTTQKVATINQQLTLALSATKTIVWDWDVLANRISWTSGYEQLFGLAAGKGIVTYEDFIVCVHPDDREAVNRAINKAHRDRADYYCEYRVIWSDRSIHWIEARGKSIYNETGRVVRMLGTTMEVSDRKANEEQLRLLESVIVNANDGVMITEAEPITSPGPRIVYVNPAFTQMTGYTLKEILGQTPRILQGEKTDPAALERIRTSLQNWQPVRVDLINYAKDRREFWAELSIVPVADRTGWFTHWVAIQRDITERKQAETTLQQLNEVLEIRVQERTFELQQSQMRLQKQLEQERLIARLSQQIHQSLELKEILNTAVTEVQKLLEADRVLVYQILPNGTGTTIAEATTGEWRSIINRIYPEEVFPEEIRQHYRKGRVYAMRDRDREDLFPCLAEFLREIQVRAKLVLPIIQHDNLWGLLIAHQCSQPRDWQTWEIDLLKQLANQLAIAIQQSELYQQLSEELSERQRAETALRQSEALFRSLSESSPIGIFRTDVEGRHIYTNPRCQAICGFTFEEALGDGWTQFVHPDDLEAILPQWKALAIANQEFRGEIRYVHRDATIHFCQVMMVPIFSESGKPMGHVGTVEDITESRAIEKMKNEFISIVSHELRTPLTSIRGSLGLLAAGVLKDQPESAKKMLEIASSDTERLVRLVNEILDLERLEANKVTLVKQTCDATTLMEQSVVTVSSLAAENNVLLETLPTSLAVLADPDRIAQTLVNLLSNAIKFSPPESTVTLSAEDLTERVLFKVEDRGRGIPADKLETIFGRFQQVDASDSRQKGGTGLGLAICRSIIQQHGGRIWAESVLGEGSIFYFTLPKS